MLGPAMGAVISLILSQMSLNAWENKRDRGIETETEQGRGKLCSHFLSFIFSEPVSPLMPLEHTGNGWLRYTCFVSYTETISLMELVYRWKNSKDLFSSHCKNIVINLPFNSSS